MGNPINFIGPGWSSSVAMIKSCIIAIPWKAWLSKMACFKKLYQRDLRLTDMGRGTVRRELEKLVFAGLLVVAREGNQHHYQANPDNPIFKSYWQLSERRLVLRM